MRKVLRGGLIAACAVFLCNAALGEATRCEALHDGVEYRSFLADQNRYVYIDVKIQPGVFPSIFVIIDKNYLDASPPHAAAQGWWLDRKRMLLFSSDQVKVSWKRQNALYAVSGWFGNPDANEIVQPIRGLTKVPGGFSGTGSHDTNGFAFQTRLEMPGFTGDAFDVTLPSVSLDGVTVSPPVVHVQRDGDTIITKC